MTDYEKAIVMNGVAVLAISVGAGIALIASMLLLPWWPAKVACALFAIYGVLRIAAAYYATK